MRAKTEAISGVTIDALLRRRRPRLRGSTYLLADRQSRPMAALEVNEPATPRLSGVAKASHAVEVAGDVEAVQEGLGVDLRLDQHGQCAPTPASFSWFTCRGRGRLRRS